MKSKPKCLATFDDSPRFRLFIERHAQEQEASRHIDETVIVLQIGDGVKYDIVHIEYQNGQRDWVARCWLKIGKGIRSVPRAGRVHMRRTSLMGRIASAVKSGRAFRGR
jgi:hypothetical protein